MISGFTFDPATHIFRKADGGRVFSATQVLAQAGICDYSFIDQETRDYSMSRGTAVHWLTQLEDQGALNYRTVPKAYRGYRRAWNLWLKASGFVPAEIEKQFVSRYGFAGIIDRTGKFSNSWNPRGITAVVDIKTGAIANHVRYQLVGYTIAAAGDDPAVARFMQRIAVRLFPDGSYSVKKFPEKDWVIDWAEFMEAVRSVNEQALERVRG